MINTKYIILCLILLVIYVIVGTLIFWGIGNLFIMVFNINYKWTFVHGFLIELIWIVLKFGGKR